VPLLREFNDFLPSPAPDLPQPRVVFCGQWGPKLYKSDREQALAKTAVALMGECDVVPTPENFELFYAFASGEHPSVTQVMSAMIANKTPFTAEALADLRMRCLSGARAARSMDTVGTGMGQVIDTVMIKLEAASRHTAAYTSTLSAATGEMNAGQSPDDMRKLVEDLMAATKAMESRTRSLEGELQKSSQQVTELRGKLDDVRKESLTDPLTNIANRKAFDAAMETAMLAQAEGESFALMMCDIDHFKKFNDSWGHQTGDQVLRLVANCLSENLKGRDTAARYGGEEFGVILRGTALTDAVHVADQIRLAVQGRKLVKKSTGDVLGTITISIGVAEFTAGDTIESVIRRADACLYGAKQNGRNMVLSEKDPRMASQISSAA
jgi:diguanylate cyclase